MVSCPGLALRGLAAAIATIALTAAVACGDDDKGDSGSPSRSNQSPSAAASAGSAGATAAGSSSSSGQGTVEGTITTSGAVTGTWSWKPGNAVSGALGTDFQATVTTTDGKFGFVKADRDGNVTFGTGAVAGGPWTGKGGKLDVKGSGASQHSCGLAVDATLSSGGTNPTKVTIKGSLSVKGTVVDPDSPVKAELRC